MTAEKITMGEMCDTIAAIADGIFEIKNRETGQALHTSEEIFNYSSTGELWKIWQWYDMVLLARKDRA